MLVILSVSNKRTAGARGRDFPDYFEGKRSTLSNQKSAPYECEAFESFHKCRRAGPRVGLIMTRRCRIAREILILWLETCKTKQIFEIFRIIIFCLKQFTSVYESLVVDFI